MKRIKELIFRTYNMFKEFYERLSKTFQNLKIVFFKQFKNSTAVVVVISY